MKTTGKTRDSIANVMLILGMTLGAFLAQQTMTDAWCAQWITLEQMLTLGYVGAVWLVAHACLKRTGRHRAAR